MFWLLFLSLSTIVILINHQHCIGSGFEEDAKIISKLLEHISYSHIALDNMS